MDLAADVLTTPSTRAFLMAARARSGATRTSWLAWPPAGLPAMGPPLEAIPPAPAGARMTFHCPSRLMGSL